MLQNQKENLQNMLMYFEEVTNARHYTSNKTSPVQEKALCMHVHMDVYIFYKCIFHNM